jgi:hypothetical protein
MLRGNFWVSRRGAKGAKRGEFLAEALRAEALRGGVSCRGAKGGAPARGALAGPCFGMDELGGELCFKGGTHEGCPCSCAFGLF